MPKAWSEDLRERVVKARASGMSVKAISELYGVHRNCVYRWEALKRARGSVKADYKPGGSPKIRKIEKFERFALAHAFHTLKQMQAAWEDEVSLMTLSRTLKKIDITRKKRPSATSKETRQGGKPS